MWCLRRQPYPHVRSDIDTCSNRNLSDVEYVDDVVQLGKVPSKIRVLISWTIVQLFGMRFTPSQVKMLFQYWVASKSKPILAGEQLDRAVTPVVSSHLEVVHRMTCLWAQKAGKTFADVSRLWHRHDIRLLIRGRAYTAVGRLVLLSGLETSAGRRCTKTFGVWTRISE